MNKNFHLNFVPLYCLIASCFMLFAFDLAAGPTDDNHIHVEQVADGDNIELNISQIGFANSIEFSFAHSGNVFNLQQNGNGNSISWVSYWGSGKSWGGDVDGSNNTENIIQYDGCLLYTSDAADEP